MFATFLLLSHVTPSIGDPKICAEAVMTLMQKDDHALAYQTIEVIRAYNSTCENMSLCTFHMDEDTASYINSATSDEANKLNLPDFPISGSIKADFEGFSSHESIDNYKASCLKEGGYIHHIDTDLVLKGTAMDLVDLDIEMKVKKFPMCLARLSHCDGEDIEKVLEEAVKLKTIENAEDLSEQQIAVINGMTIELACTATGIEKCKLTVVDSYSNISNDNNEETSGTSLLNGKLSFLLVVVVGSLIIIN